MSKDRNVGARCPYGLRILECCLVKNAVQMHLYILL